MGLLQSLYTTYLLFYSYLNYINNSINYGGKQFLVKMSNYLNMRNVMHIYFHLYLCK
jgi:hypothetical protein